MNRQIVKMKSFWNPSSAILKSIPKILAFALFGLQIGLFLQVMNGIVDFRGEKFSMRLAIDLFMNMFEFENSSFFKGLLGIFYVVVLVLMFRNLIRSIRYLIPAFGTDLQKSANAIAYLHDFAGRIYFLGALFYVIISYFGRVYYNQMTTVFFLSGMAIMLLAKFAICVWENNDMWKAIFMLIYNVIFAIAILAFLVLLDGIKLSDVLPGFRLWFQGEGDAYRILYEDDFSALVFKEVLPVFYILFHIFALRVFNQFVLCTNYYCVEMKTSVTVLFNVSVVFIVLIAVTYGYEADTIRLSAFFQGIENYLSLLLIPLVLVLSFYFPSVLSENNKKEDKGKNGEAVSFEENIAESTDVTD